MKMLSIASSVLCVIICLLGSTAGKDELISVVQLYRHGQRTPAAFYANDPYADLDTYFGGLDFGQLTNEGKRQQYALGKETRTRYSSFLPASYSRSVFYAQSTDLDRTLMSAQANLFGLFPASGVQIWKKGVTWQPIPIHPSNSAVISADLPCSAIANLVIDVFQNEEYAALDETYKDLYAYLSLHSGENITSVSDAFIIFDSLKIEADIGYDLPSWTSAVYPYPLTNISGWVFKAFTHTTVLKRLYTGALLNEIVTYFENMANNSSYSQKFQMYSAHDNNIAAILNTFGAFDPPYCPDFASTLYMELRLKDFVYVVNIYSKDGNRLTKISVNGCDLDCPLSEFRERLSDILLDTDTAIAECVEAIEA